MRDEEERRKEGGRRQQRGRKETTREWREGEDRGRGREGGSVRGVREERGEHEGARARSEAGGHTV